MGWLDVIVAVALGIFGIYLVVVLIVDDGGALEVALVVLFAVSLVMRWVQSSWTRETLSDFWKRRSRQ